MPTMGFAPDADFPIINAEKGIIDASLLIPHRPNQAEPKAVLVSFQSGLRLNMVPDAAEAVIEGPKMKRFCLHLKTCSARRTKKGKPQ